MKRWCAVLFVLLICLLQTGCWNRRELNELGIILGTSVDIQDGEWITSYQVVSPQSIAAQTGGGGTIPQSPVTVFSTRGNTLQQALANASLEMPRIPFMAHNRAIIISDKVAKRGVKEIVDLYLREPDRRETTDIFLTKGDAKKMLEVLIPMEKVPASAIDRIIQRAETNLSLIRKINVSEFASTLANPPASAVLPEVKVSGEQGAQSSIEALKETRSNAVFKIGEMGVFKKDKLIGWVSREESKGLPWITDKVKNVVITLPCKGTDSSEKKNSFVADKASTRLKPNLQDGKLKMQLEIDAEGVLTETACNIDLTKPGNITQIEQQVAKQIEKDVQLTLRGAQKLNADFLGFTEAVHKKYPDEWKTLKPNWDQAFREVELNVNVKVTIRRTGMINKPFSTLLEK